MQTAKTFVPFPVIVSYSNYEKILNDLINFLISKFGSSYGESLYELELIHSSNSSFNRDSNTYLEKQDVLAKRVDWKRKIDDLIKFAQSSLDYLSIMNSKATPNTKYEHLLIGKIIFKASPRMMGNIEFFEEYVDERFVSRFLFAQYSIKDAEQTRTFQLAEKTSDWEIGRTSVALTINDFLNEPDGFLKKRILPFQKK